jgi:hypothetical protein
MAPDIHPSAPARHKGRETVLNWTKIARQDDVELLHRNGKTLTTGRVDMVALDGSVFWLIQDNGKDRTMVLPDDDVMVFKHKCPGIRPKS